MPDKTTPDFDEFHKCAKENGSKQSRVHILTSAVILRTEGWELDFWENCTLRLPPLGVELDRIKRDRRRAG